MSHSYVVLGSGRQGAAIAYDLMKCGDAARVTLADSNEAVAIAAVQRLRTLVPRFTGEIRALRCDVADAAEAHAAMAGATVSISAVPYRFNVELTRAAIRAGSSFCDLGGNTDVVRAQLALHPNAEKAGVSIVPDCGLAPGLGNHLAAYGISLFDDARDVHVRCGGLPQQRIGPLQYKLVFNFQGLINEYSGFGEFLRNGALVHVPALTELESIDFPEPLGTCESAVTSGGTSTCPHTFLGRLRTYDYKTVRYPGHFAVIRAMFDLGCFEERVTLRDGHSVEPKALLRRLMEDRLHFPEVRDLVVLRVSVSGFKKGRARRIQFDLFDRHDETTGFSAMERTTGFPTALVAVMQARGRVAPGARPLELSVPAEEFFLDLPRHGIMVSMSAEDADPALL